MRISTTPQKNSKEKTLAYVSKYMKKNVEPFTEIYYLDQIWKNDKSKNKNH